MAGSSLSTERSDSSQIHRRSSPDLASTALESYEDTALPPINSQQLALSSRRPIHGSYRAATKFQYSQESMTTEIARGPSTHRRTGSTLKTVMRKIFNRKRGSQSDSSAETTPDSRLSNSRAPQSNKGEAENSFLALPSSLSSNQSSPLQKAHDLTGMDGSSNSLELIAPRRRRRNTLPSLILSDDGSRDARDAVFNSNTSAYSEERISHANSDQTDVRRGDLHRSKRRSRSATELFRMAKDHRMSPIQWRRRSMESDDVGSPTCGTVSDSESSYRPPTRTTVASAPNGPTEPSILEEDNQLAEQASIPPNIGNFVSSMQHNEDIPLEQRLATLEVKLIDLEFAIARMQSARGETSPAEMPKCRKPSPPDATRRHVRKQSSSNLPSHGGAESYSEGSVSGLDRPVSTGTIRAKNIYRSRTLQTPPSMSSLNDFSGISVEQYSALVMLLRREQTARRNLESQVASLQEAVEQLQGIANHDSISMGTMYPIHSKESQEFIRIRQNMGHYPQADTPPRTEEKVGSYESDSEWDRSESNSKDDGYGRSRWKSTRRIEVAGML